MTITRQGTLAAQIGEAINTCGTSLPPVDEPCAECRQMRRWSNRVVQWTSKVNSRMGALVNAVLKADDDILASLCQNCWLQDDETCECFVSRYLSLGLSLTVPLLSGYDGCLRFGTVITLENCGVESDWFDMCTPQTCESCVDVTLDPCNDADDMALARAIYEPEIRRLDVRPTGDVILNAVAEAFPGSTPTIAGIANETIYVYIGRAMTSAEIQQRLFIADKVPTPELASIRFVEPAA